MNKLRNTKKITLATLKAFVRRNKDKLYIQVETKFDGMVDCVMPVDDKNFSKVEPAGIVLENEIAGKDGWTHRNYDLGITGLWLVGSSRDTFQEHEDSQFYGINVYNSCGECVVAVKKGK